MSKITKGVNDLETLHPHIAQELHPTKNNGLVPSEVHGGSGAKLHWVCNLGHDWASRVADRTLYGNGCPYCKGKRVWAGFNDLSTTHPQLAKEFSLELNGAVKPTEINAGTHKKFWWKCNLGHHWEARANSRVSMNSGCAVCAGFKIVAGINDLEFKYPEIAKSFSRTLNNGVLPSAISAHTHKQFWWECDEGHAWKARTHDRTLKGSGCPFCSGAKVLVGFNDLRTTHPDLAQEFNCTKNVGKLPEQFSFGASVKIWWKCKKGHEWEATIASRTNMKTSCHVCSVVGKTEKSFMKEFSIQTSLDFTNIRLPLIRRLKKRGIAQIDGLNEMLKVVIEYDGWYYHGPASPNKKSYETRLLEDADTTEALLNAGYKVIRIRERTNRKILKFVKLDLNHLNSPELVDNLFQIHHDITNRDVDSVANTVRKIIEARPEWFKLP